jgi:uncharacterized membrane protein YcaP (DUF421 family)
MDSVLRGALTYFIIWLIFRLAGKRSLAELTSFDFVLLLIISETTQASLMDDNHSMTNTLLLVVTLLGIDIALSLWKQRAPAVEKLIDGVPLLLVADGVPIKEHMDKERVDEEDILSAARELRGVQRLDQIKYAVLERHGGITIIPKGKTRKAA